MNPDATSVDDVISKAGRRRLTVQLKVETQKGQFEVLEVEAYGRRQRGPSQLFFCLDVNNFEYRNIDLSLVRSAEMTRSAYTPRFPIDF
jgi:hypothetical protein